MGAAEETTAVGAVEAEQSVQDVILEMLDQDTALDPEVKDAVLEALAEVVDNSQQDAATDTAATFLTSISVVGFRGIGPQAKLDCSGPSPGLTGGQRSQWLRQVELRRSARTCPHGHQLPLSTRKKSFGPSRGGTCTSQSRVPYESALRRKGGVHSPLA